MVNLLDACCRGIGGHALYQDYKSTGVLFCFLELKRYRNRRTLLPGSISKSRNKNISQLVMSG